MRADFELQKLEQKLAIGGRHPGTEYAFVALASFQAHACCHVRQRKRPVCSPRHQALDHARANKQQRIDLLDRIFEFAELAQREFRLDRLKHMRMHTAR